jgi:NAD(P)-dependent dehydrogenase (short-subunit alcohol dehydrogenase family)
VHVCDIDSAALEKLAVESPKITRTLADVARLDHVEGLFEDVVRVLGGLDVLVNNAGIAGPTAKVEDIDPADWDRTIAIDLNAMFYCTRRAMPLLKANGRDRGGSIVNLSAVAGRLGYPLRTPYAAAKWAVVGFTKSLAMEAGPDGIRVNAIQPGLVAGERIERVIRDRADALGVSLDAQRQATLSRVSLRAFVTAQEIADLALFLATSPGRHISGQALSVCGNIETLG